MTFDPADGSGKINRHEYIGILMDKRNGIADIFFITDFFIVCVLFEGGFVAAEERLLLVEFGFEVASDERKLEVAGVAEGEKEKKGCYVEYLPHNIDIIIGLTSLN